MIDANQVWDVGQAISWVNELAEFRPLFIEEPTNPDDVLGHRKIREHVKPVGVATGENCHNRIMFKQFFQAQAIDYCQLDSCRLGGVNEVLAVLLLAAKFRVPVWPHAGGSACANTCNTSPWSIFSAYPAPWRTGSSNTSITCMSILCIPAS